MLDDHAIAAIARDLAAALIAEPNTKLLAEVEALRQRQERERIAKLEAELCDAYRKELIETLTV
jgi:hypothetical protein